MENGESLAFLARLSQPEGHGDEMEGTTGTEALELTDLVSRTL